MNTAITRSYNNTNTFKRFNSKDLGIPPTHTNHVHLSYTEKPILKTKSIKIAPMKEVEKMITDLKKENFDLKLRLYYLEDMMTKEVYKEKRINLEQKSIGTQTDNNKLFESTPEAFGLSFCFKKYTTKNDNISSVVTAFENISIDCKINRHLPCY